MGTCGLLGHTLFVIGCCCCFSILLLYDSRRIIEDPIKPIMIKVSWTNMKCLNQRKLLAIGVDHHSSDSGVDDDHVSSKSCPACGHQIHHEEKELRDWPGLPSGVKFDPTDQELIEHLEAKVGVNNSASHPLIDEFIPTLEGEDGICYTHPEKLPGTSRDGLIRHFFHRPSKAYTTGTRKRRKIQTTDSSQENSGETRWHKTGKTRPVLINGKQKGCKKILVLYTNFGKHRKPQKTNWVMHQYHLGCQEEEKEGELVVSKVFYQTQPRQCTSSSEKSSIIFEDTKADIVIEDKPLVVCDECSASSKNMASMQFPHEKPTHQDQMLQEPLQSTTTTTESMLSSEQEANQSDLFLPADDKQSVTKLFCYESAILKETATGYFSKDHHYSQLDELIGPEFAIPIPNPHQILNHNIKFNQTTHNLPLEDIFLNYYTEIKEEAFSENEEPDWARYSLWQDSGFGYGGYDCRRWK